MEEGSSRGRKRKEVETWSSSGKDYSRLPLKKDHANRPIWVCGKDTGEDGWDACLIVLETFSPYYQKAYDFLVAVAEPVSRPALMHEYKMTRESLHAAVSVGLSTDDIIQVLKRLSKTELLPEVEQFIYEHTTSFGRVKLVLRNNAYFVESEEIPVLQHLMLDDSIRESRVPTKPNEAILDPASGFIMKLLAPTLPVPQGVHVPGLPAPLPSSATSTNPLSKEKDPAVPQETLRIETYGDFVKGLKEGTGDLSGEGDEDTEQEKQRQSYSFKIDSERIRLVKRRSEQMGLPMLEEYDYKNDIHNPKLDIDIEPKTVSAIRAYQSKALNKMFGDERARSGIIVLPCGAGKTLVGILSVYTVKKSALILCNTTISAEQWKNQFLLWTTLRRDPRRIVLFVRGNVSELPAEGGCIVITTYPMITREGKRAAITERVMKQITSREWGLLIFDEVHVAPAKSFSRVIEKTMCHSKLGLSATLVREDGRITELSYLVGPKLYEANWLDLQNLGYLATVRCAEVWCPMTPEFYREYLRSDNKKVQRMLYGMNPNKLRICQFLIEYHEARGQKIIVFSDNIYALEKYARALGRYYLHGDTSQEERMEVLQKFQQSSAYNTVFLSRIGDTSIDIPEASVLIQISFQFGARRQEAQRLGRVLRPKSTGENKAYFYSLISKDTSEVFFSQKRQGFLGDQGYSYMIVTNLLEEAEKWENAHKPLLFSTREQQAQLLSEVLTASATAKFDEEIDDQQDEDGSAAGRAGKAKRAKGALSDLSGGGDTVYTELSTHRTGGASSTAKKSSSAGRGKGLFPFGKKKK